METTILTVIVGLAAVGFGVLGLVWRSLDKRMDRLEEGRETDRGEVTGIRREVMGFHREVMEMLVAQARQLGRIEGHLGLAAAAPGEAPQTSEEAAAV